MSQSTIEHAKVVSSAEWLGVASFTIQFGAGLRGLDSRAMPKEEMPASGEMESSFSFKERRSPDRRILKRKLEPRPCGNS